MDMNKIKELAYANMANKSSHPWKEKGNKYYHGERVASILIKLRKIILPEDESHDDILITAALFHDIMNGIDNHAIEGACLTKNILKNYCTPDELDAVCNIISVHDDRHSDRNLFSDYIKLHQDADHLDHFGTFDIWSCFIYAVPHEQSILDIIDWFVNIRPTEDERYLNELNYDVSKMIYLEKSEFLKSFIERFKTECTGGIWNEDKIFNSISQIK
jgi:HD superfamily phosphodiesterase